MKTKFIIITLFLISIFAISCSDDVHINGEYQEIPIVYCVLNPSQEYQYVKVNRAFLGEGSAIDAAKISDSLFFDNVQVTISEYKNSNLVNSWVCEEVNMPKDDGVFATDKNLIYRCKIPFNENNLSSKYKLEVIVDNGKHVVTGETNLVYNVKMTRPASRISLADLKGNSIYAYISGRNGYIYQTIVNFNYLEVKGNDTVYKTIEWKMPQNIHVATNEELRESFSVASFYSIVIGNIGPAEENVKRLVKMPNSLDYRVISASEDYYTYMQISMPSSGIVQHKPDFTNLEGGYGLFTSRFTSTTLSAVFNAETIHFFNSDESMRGLGFAVVTDEYYRNNNISWN